MYAHVAMSPEKAWRQNKEELLEKYLKEFRVDQCPLFLLHKCQQHRPFTCFHWHFQNQRRTRPVRRRDGTFNCSADVYCSKYDETTGLCCEGDECPYLHRLVTLKFSTTRQDVLENCDENHNPKLVLSRLGEKPSYKPEF
jgi:hypothetical protein